MTDNRFENRRNFKVIIPDQSSSLGGAGQIQIPLQSVLCLALEEMEADLQTLRIGTGQRGIHGYLDGLIEAYRYRSKVARADLLILQGHFRPGTIILGHYCSSNRLPYILISRGDLVPTPELFHIVRSPLRKWIIWLLFGRRLLAGAAAVVATSEMECQRLQKVFAYRENIRVIPDPFCDEIHEKKPSSQMIGSQKWQVNRPFALWLGRIATEKGLELLVECWPHVMERCPRALLLLAGPVYDSKVYQRLVKLRQRLGLNESIIFMDWIEGELKYRLLERARCLVLPSYFESFGITVVEALLAQTPVVVSRGAPWQQVDGVAGYWIPRKVDSWADAISTYLSAPRKMTVPLSKTRRLLTPLSEVEVAKKWNVLLKEILLD